jgi:hypothetical protein
MNRGAAPLLPGATLIEMPTTRPRYSITDTGPVQDLLDDAQQRWPDVQSRKELLLRLARAGHASLRLDQAEAEANHRRERQRAAFKRLPTLIDTGHLLSDRAWQ